MYQRYKMAIAILAFCGVFLLQITAYAQLPPAAEVVPAGFKVAGESNLGSTVLIDAKKPNQDFPKPHMDQGIELRISWLKNPAAGQILDMLAMQPEDPAGRSPGSATREEPCGKTRYRDGVLSCRKVIIPWIGAGKGPDLVTLRIGWTGKNATGLVGAELNNFYGTKEAAMSIIDPIIPKIIKGK
jgi:hypothetical protein